MTTRAAADKAALIYRETKPAIDAFKPIRAQHEAAKKILSAYMPEKGLTSFRGITLKRVAYDVLDVDKVRVYLGDKAKDFLKTLHRNSFDLAKRRAVIK